MLARNVGHSKEVEGLLTVTAAVVAVWVVWAFLTRGGLTFHLGGVYLRRRDGREATRLQCAGRELLVWGPVMLLPAAALTAAGEVPGVPLVYFGPWWGSLVLLLVYAVVAVRWPRRGPHDRLLGTWLVPD
jgi:membrane protein implicated in regulation of membrane protease activity